MEKSLVLLVPSAEILQKFMSQFHDVLHSNIFTLESKQKTLLLVTKNEKEVDAD